MKLVTLLVFSVFIAYAFAGGPPDFEDLTKKDYFVGETINVVWTQTADADYKAVKQVDVRKKDVF